MDYVGTGTKLRQKGLENRPSETLIVELRFNEAIFIRLMPLKTSFSYLNISVTYRYVCMHIVY